MPTPGLEQLLARCRSLTGGAYRMTSSGNYQGPCPVCQPDNPKGTHLSIKDGNKAGLAFCHRG